MGPGSWGRRLRRFLLAVGVLALVGVIAVLLDGWRAFGHRAEGARRARMERSPQWKEGGFKNPEPLSNSIVGAITGLSDLSRWTTPSEPVAIVTPDPERLKVPPPTGLRVTWLGHSTSLIEIDGHRVLVDPIWSERLSPIRWTGPSRWYAPLISLDALPPIDAVVISHDHYDHLDYPTITALKDRQTTFVVPLGVGAHLEYWGVPPSRIHELDWWERTRVGELEIVCTPARHASGRMGFFDSDQTLWGGYVLIGASHRVWYSGDTGLFRGMSEIGSRLGPFDLTMIDSGAYHRAWPDWHAGPEQAVKAHQMVGGAVMLPVHWGLLNLAYHGWTEPAERALVAGDRAGVVVLIPRPGQSIEPETPPEQERWWPSLAWDSAERHPVVSTQLDGPGDPPGRP